MNKVKNASARGKELKAGVQVGNPQPDSLKVNTDKPTSEKGAKLSIIRAFAVLISIQQLVITLYGWFYSADTMQEVLRSNHYLIVVVLLWAIGPKVRSKIFTIAKVITQLENKQNTRT